MTMHQIVACLAWDCYEMLIHFQKDTFTRTFMTQNTKSPRNTFVCLWKLIHPCTTQLAEDHLIAKTFYTSITFQLKMFIHHKFFYYFIVFIIFFELSEGQDYFQCFNRSSQPLVGLDYGRSVSVRMIRGMYKYKDIHEGAG